MADEKSNNPLSSDAIAEAIRAKRDGYQREERDWAAIADELIQEIESFDIDLAEQQVEQGGGVRPVMPDEPRRVFPSIVAEGVRHHVPEPPRVPEEPRLAASAFGGSPLLGTLREQARERQRQLQQELVQRTALNESIDAALRQVFDYLHELVQQLNIVKPIVPREYSLLESAVFADLAWHEGFADYRTQSQAAGALIELVTFSYQLASPRKLEVTREGAGAERLRQALFDYGLRFQCNEVRNQRRHLLRADFDIKAELSVNARWRADYGAGVVVLETRNLERLGSYSYTLSPERLGGEMLEEFGRLVLGEANRFREFCRR